MGVGEGGGGGIYLSLHCHHQNDSCIKMGSEESHFNVSSIVRDKVTTQCPQTTTQPSQSLKSLYSSGLFLYVLLSSGLLKVIMFFGSSCLSSSYSGLLKVMLFFRTSCLSSLSRSSGLLKAMMFFWSSCLISSSSGLLKVMMFFRPSCQSKQFRWLS